MKGFRLHLFLTIAIPVLALPLLAYGSSSISAAACTENTSLESNTPLADCSRTSVGFTPINDLGTGTYNGYQGGLYPAGSNLPPTTYLDEGMTTYVQAVLPRDATGQPDCAGKIVLLSIGMSNTTQEFSTFKSIADADPEKNPNLTIVDGAQGGQDAETIRNPNAQFWTIVDQRLTSANATREQVQTVWLKEAIAGENRAFPSDANGLKSALQDIVDIMRTRYPNLQVVYLSSRIYAGYASTTLNPEPYSYQSGFAAKWLIEDRIANSASRPWLAWGPYLWADGLIARSDGLQWVCSDFQSDGTHPATTGRSKVANMLLQFFKNDTTSTPWFLQSNCIPQPTSTPCPTCTPTPTRTSVPTATAGATNTPLAASTLVGRVLWQGRPAQPSSDQQLPITLTLKLGAGETNYPVMTTDASGYFTVSLGTLPSGTYTWRVKGPHGTLNTGNTPGYLARSGTVAINSGQVLHVEMGVQRASDINGDNSVGIGDFALLKNSFGKSLGQPGYDGRADINGNDVIDLPDFNAVKSNFGIAGSPPN